MTIPVEQRLCVTCGKPKGEHEWDPADHGCARWEPPFAASDDVVVPNPRGRGFRQGVITALPSSKHPASHRVVVRLEQGEAEIWDIPSADLRRPRFVVREGKPTTLGTIYNQVFDTEAQEVVGEEGEPCDASFQRDYEWVPIKLNELDAELKAAIGKADAPETKPGSRMVELSKVVEVIRRRQEMARLALTHFPDDAQILRSRHRHDALKELADDLENGMCGLEER